MSLIVTVMAGGKVAIYPGKSKDDMITLTTIEAPPTNNNTAVVTMRPEDARRIGEGLIAAADR